MAGFASFRLDRRVLEYERALLVRVAGVADFILSRRSAQLVSSDGAMRIVAIGALNEPFIHPMMEWHGELRLLLQMARIAKFRLGFRQQKIRFFAVVWRMARRAGNLIL
jgi:hypothetical protein